MKKTALYNIETKYYTYFRASGSWFLSPPFSAARTPPSSWGFLSLLFSRSLTLISPSLWFRDPKLATCSMCVCAEMAEEDPKPLNYIPEVILKKRKSREAFALRKKEQFQHKNFQSIKKPEDFIH